MTPDALTTEISAAFSRWAGEGLRHAPAGGAKISHICLKFASAGDYARTVDAARSLGDVTQQAFKGKEISWCRLREPLKGAGLALSWLELVEPKDEPAPSTGVASIGYAVPGMEPAVKIPSADGGVVFRYQALHAERLAKP